MRKIVQLFSDNYDIHLSQLRSLKHTVSSLKFKVGDIVYYHIFIYPKTANFLKSLLPRFSLEKISKTLGPASLLLIDSKSGREISRHLLDVYKFSVSNVFPNLFQNSKESIIQETLEKEVAFEPEVTGEIFKEKMQAEALEGQEQETEQKSASKMVQRPRSKVNYTK